MKHLKYFESEKQFRIIDLQQLYDDFQHFKLELEYSQDNVRNNFVKDVLSPLMLNKEVEFDGYSGEVSSAGLRTLNDKILIIGTLYGHGFDNKLTIATLDLFTNKNRTDTNSKTVKIYNCEIIDFEKKVEELKMKEDAGKYNI